MRMTSPLEKAVLGPESIPASSNASCGMPMLARYSSPTWSSASDERNPRLVAVSVGVAQARMAGRKTEPLVASTPDGTSCQWRVNM